ncbi:outer membrane protein assembly factor BamB family protein [Wolbachia endosymbiont of Dirofilaria (Dirofilaria) immitis]|uniref:outer membrane protein assembly factor BamB family protein n=1 Tax=Wolbachia endosymbiont of Dirofilaria (Dirofilaria) immitis TaxID=1812115 RepID=UPI0015886C0F|nr:PQQ-binding-like beta-propeller repeat protein [Wolbachia endosymbiont of Dirofilaria (Dirofilaria) immitis]QKX02141.1 PQQ-binding-like beta-propeller repeat protein [Wolbachia endosymbiont of Dirofilaria (Dirofilaria) immitis]
MKIVIIVVVLLCSSYTIASERIDIVDKRLSQGCVAPVLVESSIVLVDKHGTLYSFDVNNSRVVNWKLHLSRKEKIGNMSLSHHGGNIFFIVNNILYVIDAKTGEIQWKKELRAPVRGKAVVVHNKLIVLTIDNYLYAINMKDGSLIWAHQNGVNEIRGLYSISPAVSDDKIIAPFSNGELIAFDEGGKKLWSQKLAASFLDTQLTDVTTTPGILGDILIATNSSYIYGIDVKSGNILWSKPLQIKSISNIISYCNSPVSAKERGASGRIFMITRDNRIIGINIQNGETVWTFDSIKNTQLFALVMHAHMLWVIGNKGLMFAFSESESTGKTIKIPGNVFHAPVFVRDKIYITTEGSGVFSLENRFIFYDES